VVLAVVLSFATMIPVKKFVAIAEPLQEIISKLPLSEGHLPSGTWISVTELVSLPL
jgi:hypothetical protein